MKTKTLALFAVAAIVVLFFGFAFISSKQIAKFIAAIQVPKSILPSLTSSYFSNDKAAQSIAKGYTSVKMPGSLETGVFNDRGIAWRIVNAYRMIGYESTAMPIGKTIGKNQILELDRQLAIKERKIKQKVAASFSFYEKHSAPNFKDNIPQSFMAYNFATLFDLFNAGRIKYQSNNYECLLANLAYLPGLLVNNGETDPVIVQTPEFFGFGGRTDLISANEYPIHANQSTFLLTAYAVHEIVHTLDAERLRRRSTSFDRLVYCSPNMFNLNYNIPGIPFVYNGRPGEQNPNDYVSQYAAGLVGQEQKNYLSWEDVAESVTTYILLPEYFRDKAQRSVALKQKYDFIKTQIFKGTEFHNGNFIHLPSYVFPSGIEGFYRDNITPNQKFELDKITATTTSVPEINVVSPNGGETLNVGDRTNISWNSQLLAGTGNVTIKLVNDDLKKEYNIATVLAGTGSYLWTIPPSINADRLLGDKFKILIFYNGTFYSDKSDGYFTISSPSLTLTSPNGGETWNAGETHNITWTSSGLPSTANLKIEILNYFTPIYTFNVPAGSNSYSWTIPVDIYATDYYSIRVYQPTLALSDSSNNNFTIHNSSDRTIRITSPNGGEVWQAGNTYDIKWQSENLDSTIINIFLYVEGTRSIIASNIPISDGLYSWTIPLNLLPKWTYRIFVRTPSGTFVDFSDNDFSIVAPGSAKTVPK